MTNSKIMNTKEIGEFIKTPEMQKSIRLHNKIVNNIRIKYHLTKKQAEKLVSKITEYNPKDEDDVYAIAVSLFHRPLREW
jgi:hypothetical protein